MDHLHIIKKKIGHSSKLIVFFFFTQLLTFKGVFNILAYVYFAKINVIMLILIFYILIISILYMLMIIYVINDNMIKVMKI